MMTADEQFDNCLQPTGAHSIFDFDRPAFSRPHGCGNSVALQHVVRPGGSLLKAPSSHSLLQSQGQRYQNPNIMGVGVIRERPNSTRVAYGTPVLSVEKGTAGKLVRKASGNAEMNRSCESKCPLPPSPMIWGSGGLWFVRALLLWPQLKDTGVMPSRKELQYQHRQYLKSPEWFDLREQVLERDGWKCVICEFVGRLDGHHVRYPQDPYECPTYFVVALCRKCHDEVHDEGKHKDWLMVKSLQLEQDYLRERIEHLEEWYAEVERAENVLLDKMITQLKKLEV